MFQQIKTHSEMFQLLGRLLFGEFGIKNEKFEEKNFKSCFSAIIPLNNRTMVFMHEEVETFVSFL